MIKPSVGLKKYIFTGLVECLHVHRMADWQMLEGISGQSHSSPLLMQGHVQLIAQACVQTAFEYI